MCGFFFKRVGSNEVSRRMAPLDFEKMAVKVYGWEC